MEELIKQVREQVETEEEDIKEILMALLRVLPMAMVELAIEVTDHLMEMV